MEVGGDCRKKQWVSQELNPSYWLLGDGRMFRYDFRIIVLRVQTIAIISYLLQ
jgi:hypothetical protein